MKLPCIVRRCQEYAIPGASRCQPHELEFQRDRKAAGRTGHRGSTARWRKLREETHAKQQGICGRCKKSMPDRYDVHHLDGDANNDAPSNLMAVHEDCHKAIEAERRLARYGLDRTREG